MMVFLLRGDGHGILPSTGSAVVSVPYKSLGVVVLFSRAGRGIPRRYEKGDMVS